MRFFLLILLSAALASCQNLPLNGQNELGRFVPFGSENHMILDTKTGDVYRQLGSGKEYFLYGRLNSDVAWLDARNAQ